MKNSIKFSFIYLILMLGFVLETKAQNQPICETPDQPLQSPVFLNSTSSNFPQCPDATIDFGDYDWVAPIIIYVNVHFKPTSSGQNFDPPTAVALANELINTANGYLNNMEQNEKPGPSGSQSPHVPQAKWQYKIYTENLPNDNLGGIWIEPNANSGMYNTKVVDIWLEGTGGCHSGWSCTGCDVTLTGFFDCHDDWYARIMNHEFGHSLSLNHSAYCDNQCKTKDIDPEQECGPNCPAVAKCDCWNPSKILCVSGGSTACYPPVPNPVPTEWMSRCQWGWGNNMMQQGWKQNALTPCQWETAFNYMRNSGSPKYSWADKCSIVGPTYFVQSGTNEVWDDLKLLNRNVEVKTGATLTITCEVRMATGLKIIVQRGAKLIVDGGKITNLCPGGLWGGINVHGNSAKAQPDPFGTLANDDAGVVIVMNNSIIEHAPTAISTTAPGFPYADQVARWGGVIYAENSSFINNRRAAEFMKYGFSNKSKFNNCDFGEDGAWGNNTVGVTIWDCDDITFTGNRFEHLDIAAIGGVDYGAKITDGNNFEDANRAIESMATYPYSSFVDIYNNYFDNNKIHVFSSSTDKLDGLRIQGNEFFTSDYGVWIEGSAKYDIRKNSFFKETWGTVSWKTGVQNNYIDCNTIQDVTVATNILGNNRNLQFRGNTYLNSFFDVQLDKVGTEKGRVRSFQGAAGQPADNCFFDSNADDIRALSANSLPFTYIHRSVKGASCYKPTNNLSDGGTNNYFTNKTSGTLDCPPPFKDGAIGEPPYVKDDLIKMRTKISDALVALSSSPEDKDLQFSHEDAVTGKNKVLLWLMKQALDEKNYDQAEKYLVEENTKESKRWIYGLKIERGDYVAAKAVLNSIPQEEADDQLFALVQDINLKRFQATEEFTLSQEQENLLYVVAESDYSSRGYARALLNLLKGVRFEVSLELPNGAERPQERSTVQNKAESEFVVYPNPTKDLVNVKYPIRRGETAAYCQLSDVYGKVHYSTKLDNSGTLMFDTTQFADGLYSIQIIERGRVFYSTLLSIIR
jgi:Secretion system C-terminal sorting domain/Periplasmic copper-binding protein (NosD)